MMNDKVGCTTSPKALKRNSPRACTGDSIQPQSPRHALMRQLRAFFSGRNEGGALIEIALVMPMLLVIVTGIFAFGVAFNNELTLTTAVGAGAQQLQLIRTTTSDPCADTFSAITAAAPSLTSSNITLSVTMNGTTVNGSTCSGYQTDLVAGTAVTVSATYPCPLHIYSLSFASNCLLSAKVSEYEY